VSKRGREYGHGTVATKDLAENFLAADNATAQFLQDAWNQLVVLLKEAGYGGTDGFRHFPSTTYVINCKSWYLPAPQGIVKVCLLDAMLSLKRTDERSMVLLKGVVQHFDQIEPYSVLEYVRTEFARGHWVRVKGSMHEPYWESCEKEEVYRCLLEAGALIPKDLIAESEICQLFVTLICAARSACFCFLAIKKFGRLPGLIPNDVVRLICRAYVWPSRREVSVWAQADQKERDSKNKNPCV